MAETSRLKDLVTFLSSIKGDLANITSPPNLLAPKSVTEVAGAWTERPSVFVAPTREPDPQKRALLVTRWILSSLKSQYDVGGSNGGGGIKKPLNAFLGELFLGQWTQDGVTANIIAEQVSHHPPVTASYLWNKEHGIRGEGYTRVEMTFDGSINIKQNGHALIHLENFNDETYLIPVPNAKVRGFLSGSLHLELDGTYHIVSSTGFVTEINFFTEKTGGGLLSSKGSERKNSFEAKLYRAESGPESPLYTMVGQWDGIFEIRDVGSDTVIETWDPASAPPSAPVQVPDTDSQDAWETRRAWRKVLDAVRAGDMRGIVAEKSRVEEGQRAMRRVEESKGETWRPLFFEQLPGDQDPGFEKLGAVVGWQLKPEKTKGVWRVKRDKAETDPPHRPFHGDLKPYE